MMINKYVGVIVGVILLVLAATLATGAAAPPDKEQAAVSATEEWLGLVDEGKYAESWSQAAEYFRNAVKQEQWEHAADAARKPLGQLVSRTLKRTDYRTSIPGAPDGEYIVIEFSTSFENKESAIETVTPMMDKDGKWRVSGYYIR